MRLVEELSRAAGTVGGMIGGQVDDLEGERQATDAHLLESIHRAKTGALLRASVRMGGSMQAHRPAEFAALSCYGEHVGLAFQIVDDILDVEESSEALGKTAGKDEAQQKITFPAVYGLERSREMAEEERLACPSGAANVRRPRRAAPADCRLDRPAKGVTSSPAERRQRLDLAAGGPRAGRIPRKGAGADHGGQGDGRRPEGRQARPDRVPNDARIRTVEQPLRYVSRGGLKLEARCAHFRFQSTDKVCLDVGTSTGGIYRLPAAARRGARACGRYGRRPDRLEAAHRSARDPA